MSMKPGKRTPNKFKAKSVRRNVIAFVLLPSPRPFRFLYFTSCQCLGFHLQIGFSVDVGGIIRDVAQPGADGVDIYSSTEKMWRSCGAYSACGIIDTRSRPLFLGTATTIARFRS